MWKKGANLIMEQIKTNKIERGNVIKVFQDKFSVTVMLDKLEEVFCEV